MLSIRNLGILFIAALMIASCTSYEQSKEKRAQLAANAKGPIYIAIAWPLHDNHYPFLNGISLAVDEINQAGGIMGRQLETITYDATEDNAQAAAVKIAKNEDIVAVVGHHTSTSAIKASITYEENGILFLAPSSTNPSLTAHKFEYVFRTAPSDILIGRNLARFTHRRGYRRVIILDDDSIFGKGLAVTYYAAAVDLDIEVILHKAYFQWQSDYKSLISEFTKLNFDAIFLAGAMPNAALMIKQCRGMGIDVPFISGDSLDLPNLPLIVGPAAGSIAVPSVFDPYADEPRVRAFVTAFQQKYHAEPQTWDALGYDTIKLLAFAFEKSASTVPIVVSSTLRVISHWQGVTGDFTFDKKGDLKDKKLYFKEVHNGQFEFIKE